MTTTRTHGRPVRLSGLALALIVAALLRLGWVLYSPVVQTSDFATYRELGLSLAGGEGFSLNGQPTAYRPPGYSFFLGGVFALSAGSVRAAQLAQVALGVLTVLLTQRIGRRLFDERVSLPAAWMVACFPSLIAYTSLLASENLALPLFLASMLAFLVYLQGSRLRWALAAGLLCGLTGLIRPEVLPLIGLWAVYAGVRGRSLSAFARAGSVLAIGVAAALLPWTLRNALVFGRLAPVSSNNGIMLLASFNPQSSDPEANAEAFQPLYAQAAQSGWDEFQLSAAARRMALDYLRDNPWQILAFAPVKLFHLMGDDVSGISWNLKLTSRPVDPGIAVPLKALAQLYYLAVLLLAAASLFFHRAFRQHPFFAFLLIPIGYWLLFFALFIATDRYHLLILPLLALLAAFTLGHLRGGKLLPQMNADKKR